MTVTKTIPYRSTFLAQEAADAWKYFQEAGYPNSKNENWRFSNPLPWLNLNGERISSDNNFEKVLYFLQQMKTYDNLQHPQMNL